MSRGLISMSTSNLLISEVVIPTNILMTTSAEKRLKQSYGDSNRLLQLYRDK